MPKAVACAAESHPQTTNIVEQLRTAGFARRDILVAYPDERDEMSIQLLPQTMAPQGAAFGSAIGVILGGILGAMAGVKWITIPFFDPFLTAGTMMASVSGGFLGGFLGAAIGLSIGLQFPDEEYIQLKAKLKKEGIRIVVHAETEDRWSQVKSIFESAGARDISFRE
jgi:hypothetical protein